MAGKEAETEEGKELALATAIKADRVQLLSTITPDLFLKKAATYSPTFAVPSAQLGLTSLFGMGRGGTPTL